MMDEELVEVSWSGGGLSQVFDELVFCYQGWIMVNCRYILKLLNDVEDLVQEVFVKVFFVFFCFEVCLLFKIWFQCIKINYCLNYFEKKCGKIFIDVEELGFVVVDEMRVQLCVECDFSFIEDCECIEIVFDDFLEVLWVLFVLCEVDGFFYQEIVDYFEISLLVVKMCIKCVCEVFCDDWDCF